MDDVTHLVRLRPVDRALDSNASDPTTSPGRSTLKAFLAALAPQLSARDMHAAAAKAGYSTTLASIYAARTALGLAKPRFKFARKTPPKPAPETAPEFVPPSDEAILTHLILKIGLERAAQVFAHVERHAAELDL